MKTKDLNKMIFNLSIIAGIRAMGALSVLNQYLLEHPSKRLAKTPLGFIQTQNAASVFKFLATGEMLGDKLPFIPDRIKPAPLLARALTGALIGTTLSSTTKSKKIKQGAVLGLIGAVASSYFFYFLRKKPAAKSTFSNALWGTVEDGLVLKQGQKLLN